MSALRRPPKSGVALLAFLACSASAARAGPATDGTGIGVELTPRFAERHALVLSKPRDGSPAKPVIRTWIAIPRSASIAIEEISGASVERSPSDSPFGATQGEVIALETDRNDVTIVLKGKDPIGLSKSLTLRQRLAFQRPYFWLHSSCAERGLGIARRKSSARDVRFLLSAAVCEGEGEAMQLTLHYSPDATWRGGTIPNEAGHGNGWRKFKLSLNENAASEAIVGGFHLQENRPKGLVSENLITYPSPESEYPALEELHRKEHAAVESAAEARLREGERLQALGKFAEAAAKYRASRESAPDLTEAWLKEVHALKKAGRFQEADVTARALADRRPELKEVLLR